MKTNDPHSRTNELRLIFNEADPQGIFFGDNHDEYDPEIIAIDKILPSCNSAVEIKKALWSIFKEKFGANIAGPESDYDALSSRIFDWTKTKARGR